MPIVPRRPARAPRRAAARAVALAALFVAALPALAQAARPADPRPRLLVETSRGNFVVELDAERAPLTVANFLRYAADGHYDNTVVHRSIAGFVVQFGGFGTDFVERKTRAPIPNEAGNGLSNRRGTLGMARTGDPHSGSAQWYVNLADNTGLDPLPSRWGYAVFGRVVQGMEVLDGISLIPTGAGGPFPAEVPQQAVVVRRIAPAPQPAAAAPGEAPRPAPPPPGAAPPPDAPPPPGRPADPAADGQAPPP